VRSNAARRAQIAAVLGEKPQPAQLGIIHAGGSGSV